MSRNRFSFFYLFLLPVLFLALSWQIWAEDSDEAETKPISESALSRLVEISLQLSTLNERLRGELLDSKQSSRELQNMLEASRKELEELKQELGVLRSSSTGLLTKAESSQRELIGLLAALKTAESSLMSLELSFAAYKQTAESSIKRLGREKTLWKWGCIAAGVLAIGFGGALLFGR